MIGVTRQLRRFPVQRISCQTDDTEQALQPLTGTLLRPVQRRALRIGIDQGHALALPRPFAGEVQRQRRLADAALLIEERDDHDAPRLTALAPCLSCARPNKEV